MKFSQILVTLCVILLESACHCRLCPKNENVKLDRRPRNVGDDVEVEVESNWIPVTKRPKVEGEFVECFNETRFGQSSFENENENEIADNERPFKTQRKHLKTKKKSSFKFPEDSSIISRIVSNLIRFLISRENPLSSTRDSEIKQFIDDSFLQSWNLESDPNDDDDKYDELWHRQEVEESEEEEFEFVEPMVFDLVRGLGAKVGESEVNYLMIIPLNGQTVRNLSIFNNYEQLKSDD